MTHRILPPDEANLITLPGVGPCPRPVDIDQAVTGFQRLKSLRAYRFGAGQTIEGESEVDEVLITPVKGHVRLEIEGLHPMTADLGPGQILYMPPDHAYRLTPAEDAIVAYGRALGTGAFATTLRDDGAAAGKVLGLTRETLTAGASLALEAESLALVAEGGVTLSGASAGPLSVVAVGTGEASVTADAETILWVYSA